MLGEPTKAEDQLARLADICRSPAPKPTISSVRSPRIIRWQHAEFSQATKPGVAPGIGCAGCEHLEIVKAILGRRQPAKLRGGFRWAGGNSGAEMLASPYRRDAMPQRGATRAAAGVDEKLPVPRLNQRAWPETILARDRSSGPKSHSRHCCSFIPEASTTFAQWGEVASLRAGHSFPAFRLPARHRAWRKPHEPAASPTPCFPMFWRAMTSLLVPHFTAKPTRSSTTRSGKRILALLRKSGENGRRPCG